VDVDGDGLALRGGLVGVVEGGDEVVAADERGRVDDRPGHDAAGRGRGAGLGERGEQVGAGEAVRGVAAQQAHAQIDEVLRGVGGELVDVDGVVLLLGGEDAQGGADEREAAGEGLVEHHADAVPVAGGGRGLAGGLLGRHVRGGPEDAVLEGGVDRGDDAVADEAEVEDDDAARAGDEHVGRLEVAVELARDVQGGDAGDQLGERVAQALDDEARRGDGLGDRVLVAVVGGGLGGGGRRAVGSDVVAEAHALDVLHGDEPLVVVGHELVEGDEVVVGDAGGRTELVLEAVEAAGLERAERLEGDAAAAFAVEGGVDDAHAAGPELADQVVAAEPPRKAVRRGVMRVLRAAPRGVLHPGAAGESRRVNPLRIVGFHGAKRVCHAVVTARADAADGGVAVRRRRRWTQLRCKAGWTQGGPEPHQRGSPRTSIPRPGPGRMGRSGV
jgi:hypothetical protein